MTQTANLRTKRANRSLHPLAAQSKRPSALLRPSPNRPARRKRQLTQRMRHFGLAFAALPGAARRWQQSWSLPRLAVVGVTRWCASKVLSLVLLLSVAGALYWVHTDERWFVYREDVQFNGVAYLSTDELYEASALEGWNIFWLQPQSVREHLLTLPYVANVTLQLTLAHPVTINVQAVAPTALWVTEQGTLWLLADGTALPAPDAEPPAVLRIIDNAQAARAIDTTDTLRIEPTVLQSALALQQQVPALDKLRFNQDYGLNFHLRAGNAWVYWGDGYRMAQKFANLAAVQTLIETGQAQPELIDIRFDRPYIR